MDGKPYRRQSCPRLELISASSGRADDRCAEPQVHAGGRRAVDHLCTRRRELDQCQRRKRLRVLHDHGASHRHRACGAGEGHRHVERRKARASHGQTDLADVVRNLQWADRAGAGAHDRPLAKLVHATRDQSGHLDDGLGLGLVDRRDMHVLGGAADGRVVAVCAGSVVAVACGYRQEREVDLGHRVDHGDGVGDVLLHRHTVLAGPQVVDFEPLREVREADPARLEQHVVLGVAAAEDEARRRLSDGSPRRRATGCERMCVSRSTVQPPSANTSSASSASTQTTDALQRLKCRRMEIVQVCLGQRREADAASMQASGARMSSSPCPLRVVAYRAQEKFAFQSTLCKG